MPRGVDIVHVNAFVETWLVEVQTEMWKLLETAVYIVFGLIVAGYAVALVVDWWRNR